MYESTQATEKYTRDCVSRHLGCKPKSLNGKMFSPVAKKRLFWSNIPGMDNLEGVRQKRHFEIEDCLTKERNFRCKREIDTINSRRDSVLIHENEGGHRHTDDCYLCSEEVEKVTGMPAGYTEVEGLSPRERRKLIAEASSVPCLTELLKLLKVCFNTQQDI